MKVITISKKFQFVFGFSEKSTLMVS